MATLRPSMGKMFLQSTQHPVKLGSGHGSFDFLGTTSGCRNDFTLQPFVSGCRGDFDFTILFEHFVLSVIPSVCFLALSLRRIWRLHSRRVIIEGHFLFQSKVIVISVWGATNMSLILVISQQADDAANQAALASAVLIVIGSPVMAYLSYLEHYRSFRTSILLNSYFVITMILNVIRTRTIWLVHGKQPYSILFTVATTVLAAVVFLEAMPKLRWLKSTQDTSQEETSGLYSLLFMSWVNPLLKLGNRKIMGNADLYTLDSRLSAAVQSKAFQKELRQSQPPHKRHLGFILFKAISRSFLQAIPSRLAMVTFSFCQPFFMERLIRFMECDPLSNRNTGPGLILASVLIYTGLAFSNSTFSRLHLRAVSKSRSALVTAIYRKAIERSSTHLDTDVLTLMSTDVERITEGGLYPLHDIWANTFGVILASIFLHRQLGSAFIAPILVVSASVVSTSFIAKFTGPAMSKWTQSTEARVRLTTAVVAGMKALKISGLSDSITEMLRKSREDEQRVGNAYRILVVVSITSAFTPMFLAPVATFAWVGRQLSMAEAFSSLSYVALITSPLTQLFQKIPGILASFACLTRIQNFLDTETRSEYRIFRGPTAETGEMSVAISLENADFGWAQDQRQLKELNLNIPRSSLTVVTGPVAAGKSTLCKALLGEVPFTEGLITFHQGLPRIGYCDQTPFLVNASIRSNIVGFEPFDSKLYDEVLEAVILKDDLRSLPRGDDTQIGSSGISLSGGQKQRVALARALYLVADVYILDDCTVSLDKPTADEIVSRLFGTHGFLRRGKATTVWCTHSVQYLPLADNVIALGGDGRVAHQGPPQETLSDEQLYAAVDHDKDGPDQEDIAPDTELSTGANSKAGHEDEKDPTRSLNDSSVYSHYFSSFGPLLISTVLLSGLLWGFFWNAGTLFLKYWADNGFQIPGYQSHVNNVYLRIYSMLQLSGIIVMGFYIASTDMGMARVGGSVLHHKAVKALMAAPLQYFTETDQGVTVNLFSQDINLIDFFLPKSMSNTLLAFFASAGQAVVVAIGTPYVALAYPVLLIFLSYLSRFYLRTSRQLRLLDLEAKSPLYAQFQDTIRGIATIRAFGWVPYYTAENHARVDDSLRPAYLLSMSQVWLMLVLKLVVAFIAVSVTVLATQVMSLSGRAGFVGAGMISLMELGNMMNACVHSWIHLEMSFGAVKRLRDFGEKSGREDGGGEDVRPAESWPEKGEIVISGVDASYEKERYKDENYDRKLVLKEIQMNIRTGEKVAVVGRTGSGKSSLILLLLRLLDPTSDTAGNITIDGTPLRKVHRSTLRQRIIAMPQEMVFLAGGKCFRAALDPYSRNTDEECQSALELVGLWPVVQRSGGLQTEMTKEVFSQGQKQLFSLAIAIIRARFRQKRGCRGGILLLDEVTASVDRDTEQIMMEVIHQMFSEYTVLAVTHHLESVAGFDRIIVMKNGQVIKEGTPDSFSQEQESVSGS